ncbi:MAG: cell division topological specificity factor MinE [Anaerolineales bacterium]|nr:cell division topological specificity factor MinE [Anaerolineales bacterium]
MSWLEKLFGQREKSGAVAKQRLQMVLIHDRSDLSPGLLELIKDDIIEVIAKRLEINRENVVVNLERTEKDSVLVAEVPLLPGNGRSAPTS